MTHDHEQQVMLPPHSREAEEAILGAILIDEKTFFDVNDIIIPQSFYMQAHAWIYEAMCDLMNRNSLVDSLTVIEAMKAKGRLEDIGGEPFIIGLTSAAIWGMNVRHYAKIVAEHAKRRGMINAAQRIANLAHDTEKELRDVLQAAQGEAASALDDSEQAKNRRSAGAVASDLIQMAEAARLGHFAKTLGFPWHTMRQVRAVRGAMVVLGARPMMGKTSFLLQWMRYTAEQGQFCMFFSLEMTAEECVARMIMQATGIDEKRVLGMEGFEPLTDAEIKRVYQEQGRIDALPLVIDDTGSMHIDSLQSRCRAEYLRRGGESIAVFVDYLQYLYGGRNGASNYESVSDVSRKLKNVAKDVGWVAVAVQLNRSLESRQDKRPMQSDARDSGQIEQDANIFLGLYRDEVYFPDTTERPNVAEVIALKNRSGRTGSFDLFWKGDAVSFGDLARQDVQL